MPLVPPSEHLARLDCRRGRGAWRALPLSVLAGSCFFKLPPPLEDSIDGGFPSAGGGPGASGAGGGTAGPSLGGTNAGGTAGAAGSGPTCPSDQKLCSDQQCHPQTPELGCGSTDCQPCSGPAGTVMGCEEGACAVIGCLPGLADCDGDTLNGDLGGNGCEYSLGSTQSSDATNTVLSVPHRQITVDGSRQDWTGIPAYAFTALCPHCRDDNSAPISADATVPPRTDLDASFRVAWDENNLYVFVEAFDNHISDSGSSGNHCSIGAACDDGVQVFFDGLNNRSTQTGGYGSDDHRVFLGLSEKFEAPAQGQPRTEDVAVRTERQGQFCYRIEAQFHWNYIVFGSSQGATAPNQFPPAAGQSYGFDIAIEDWDPSIGDSSVVERQSQVFWSDPGTNYANSPSGIVGSMTLAAPTSDAGLQ